MDLYTYLYVYIYICIYICMYKVIEKEEQLQTNIQKAVTICMYTPICMCIHIYMKIYVCTYIQEAEALIDMGQLRLVGSIKVQVFWAEYRLFHRALLQKRPMTLRSLLIVATPYIKKTMTICVYTPIYIYIYIYVYICKYTYIQVKEEEGEAQIDIKMAVAEEERISVILQAIRTHTSNPGIQVCWSVSQCVTACCRVLQFVAVWCSVLQRLRRCGSV